MSSVSQSLSDWSEDLHNNRSRQSSIGQKYIVVLLMTLLRYSQYFSAKSLNAQFSEGSAPADSLPPNCIHDVWRLYHDGLIGHASSESTFLNRVVWDTLVKRLRDRLEHIFFLLLEKWTSLYIYLLLNRYI